jgi:DNA-binding NarL/FixJ family response regulator
VTAILTRPRAATENSPDRPGGSTPGVTPDDQAENHSRSLFDSREGPTSTASANQAPPGAGEPAVRPQVIDALCRGDRTTNPTKTERVEAIRRLAAKGCSDAVIGQRIGRTPGTVCVIRRQHAIPAGHAIANAEWRGTIRALLAEGLTDPQVANRLGVSVSAVAYQRYCIRAEDLRAEDSRQVAS